MLFIRQNVGWPKVRGGGTAWHGISMLGFVLTTYVHGLSPVPFVDFPWVYVYDIFILERELGGLLL